MPATRKPLGGFLLLLFGLGAVGIACGHVIDEQFTPVLVPAEAGPTTDGTPEPDDAHPPDAGDAGITDAALDGWSAFVERCAPRRALGSFATYYGKVNVHTLTDGVGDGGWLVDDDCTSGATVFDLAYCRKFWDASDEIRGPDPPDFTFKPFYNAACEMYFPSRGEVQYVCCGPP